ncbi:MAG TPA: nickel-binding protein [Dehalococcoidia bacterium]|nr:nickel-binding protein [Dehalococcoidia bacterium]
MPLFMIRRDLPGATQEDMDAAAYRAMACIYHFEGMRWITSYWDRDAEVIHCVYEAEKREEVIDHARRARIPCDDVREVQHVGPELYAPAVEEAVATNAG